MNDHKDNDGFDCFITRSGDRLMEGDREYRFVSINIPNLHVNEDPLPYWHRIDPWEVEDAFRTIRLMGGRVTRIYTLSIRGGIRPGNSGIAHLYGPGQFDEQLFRDLDKVLELAAKHRIRLIIPFIDQWDWFGGIKHFAAFRDRPAEQFWTDRQLIEDFKEVITYVLNRTNTFTGVKYKDDKTIMAWETGNELDSPDPWIHEIVSHIRSLDEKHLILDGRYGISSASLEHPDIDIVSNHYYTDRGKDFLARITADRTMSKGKKPFLIGEFGHHDPEVFSALLDAVVENGASGALAWSLRYHNKDGGFYYQGNPDDPGHCMNWPGFPSRPGESEKLKALHKNAYRIQGLAVPEKPIPDPPMLLPIRTPDEIAWRGSAGACSYSIERAHAPEGPWTVIADEVYEHMIPFVPFQAAPSDVGTYYYRIRARNESGLSGPSNLEAVTLGAPSDFTGPVTRDIRYRVSVTRTPVDPEATSAAKRLMSYISDIYGSRIIAGQQCSSPEAAEAKVIYENTGQSPALLGFDFMDYSPSRIPFGAVGSHTEAAIRWGRDGGIVTFCWHWNAPKDLPNELPDKAWYSGFYTRATTFDIEKAMNHPDSEDYLLILRDIDAIAEQLKKLQEADIPVLWRPLHEASGGWFWWGAKGPGPCIKLWRLLYDRLTRTHGLHNLIWVWNGQHVDWYPGDDVVDMIGEDIYGGPLAYGSQYERFRAALACTSVNKVIALTENGTIPDPDKLALDEVPWAWFCTWCGTFVIRMEDGEAVYSEEHTELEMLKKVYEHPNVITKERLPDLRAYPLPLS